MNILIKKDEKLEGYKSIEKKMNDLVEENTGMKKKKSTIN